MAIELKNGIQITGDMQPGYDGILTDEALAFVAGLQRAFNERRVQLLEQRKTAQDAIDEGTLPGFVPETSDIRVRRWQVAPVPDDLQQRRVEITGPTDRKMVINALNSGADVFMADFEDANSPTWDNMVQGQINLHDAIRRQVDFTNPDGKSYALNEKTAVLLVRPRGWHLDEKHMLVDDEPVSGSLFDFGLYFFHNAKELLERGSGPYYYLPKLENYHEARLWNDVFIKAQEDLGIPNGTIKVTVLLEHILLSFQIEEVLYELRDHMAGINAGRWDYIFSTIKKFRRQMDTPFPDRAQITMTVPFMRAYTELLVKTCHGRGAHAIGGMAAFIPSRRDQEINAQAFEKVRADKLREANDGFDGTWVAHPDLVPVAMEVFQEQLGDKLNQKDRMREDVHVTAADLLNFEIADGEITEEGLRLNVNVALQYIESWLRGTGAAAIFNLMEDAATAEISRAQLWQWVHHPAAKLSDGREINAELFLSCVPEELDKIKAMYGEELYNSGRFDEAREILEQLVTEADFTEFLTWVAYDRL